MGLFQKINEQKQQRAEIEKAIKAAEDRVEEYKAMSEDEFRALPDDEIYAAALARTEEIVKLYDTPMEGFEALDYERQIFYVTAHYEAEMSSGGMLKFLSGAGQSFATYMLPCFEELGCEEHSDLFESFIIRNNIDVNELSDFQVSNMQEYRYVSSKYPFGNYNEAYSNLPLLKPILTDYIRQNMDVFCIGVYDTNIQ